MTPEWCRVTEAGLNPRRISITPLDPEKHDRASFSCGTVRLDNFLKRSARKHQSGDFTRVWVATEGGRDEILGYYALNAHSLEGEGFPVQPDKTRSPVREYPNHLPLDDRRGPAPSASRHRAFAAG